MTKQGLLNAFQHAIETVDVIKFEAALCHFTIEYNIEMPSAAAELIKAQDDNLSKEKIKEIMLKIQIPIVNYIRTNGKLNDLK